MQGLVRRTTFQKEERIAWERIQSAAVCSLPSRRTQNETPLVFQFYCSAEIAEKAKENGEKSGIPLGCRNSFFALTQEGDRHLRIQ